MKPQVLLIIQHGTAQPQTTQFNQPKLTFVWAKERTTDDRRNMAESRVLRVWWWGGLSWFVSLSSGTPLWLSKVAEIGLFLCKNPALWLFARLHQSWNRLCKTAGSPTRRDLLAAASLIPRILLPACLSLASVSPFHLLPPLPPRAAVFPYHWCGAGRLSGPELLSPAQWTLLIGSPGTEQDSNREGMLKRTRAYASHL